MKDRLFNNSVAKKIAKDNESICSKIDSMINTSKNGETKFYKAFEELKSVVKNNCGNNVREQLIKKSEKIDRQTGRRRKRSGRRFRFLSS